MAPPTPHLRWRRLLLSGLAGLVLLGVIAYVALNQAFPPERLAAMLSEQVRKTTGRDFAVRGPLSIRLLPRIGVSADDVVLGNAPWGTRKDMLVVKHARFDIALWPLLHGQVDIASVSFDGVDLLLETNQNGVGNWAMGREGDAPSPAPPGGGSSEPLRLHLARLSLSDAKLAYRDGRSGSTHNVTVPKLELDAAGDGQALAATFVSGAQRWQLKGQIGSVADLALNQADWPFDLQLSSDGAAASAKGLLRRGTPPRALQADISASLTKAAALAPWVTDASRLPLPAELKGRLSFAPQSAAHRWPAAVAGAAAAQRADQGTGRQPVAHRCAAGFAVHRPGALAAAARCRRRARRRLRIDASSATRRWRWTPCPPGRRRWRCVWTSCWCRACRRCRS